MAAGLTSYDAVAYPGYPLRQTHPGRLAAIAAVHGLAPALPSRCRVLELGAGDGANIIPMAYALSDSLFLGIDLASAPVERGRQCIAELGLTNIDLRCGDVMDLPADLGRFDYIIAHGLYSWVPAPVRDRVLAVCRDHLAPHGVAYISYNTYPGCHMRQMVRGIMRYHTRAIEDPQERISQARAIVKFVADGQSAPGAFGDVLSEESRRSAYVEDEALLFHDDLAEVSDPFWFHEFMDHAASKGLRFLAEADYHMSDVQHLPDAIREKLEPLRQSDVVEFEQYLDFLKCRRFRQSLLCRAEAPVRNEPDPGRVATMAAACPAKPDGVPDLTPGTTIAFRAPKGNWTMSIDLPVGKAALLHLSESYPASLPFAELLAATSERLGSETIGSDPEALAEVLLAGFAVGLVELTADAPRFTRKAGAQPRASAVAQLQLRAGTERPTNLRHERAKVDHPLTRQLVLLMDGSRDRAALVEGLTEWTIAHSQGGREAMGPDRVRSVLAGQIESELNKVADLALIHM
jgi:SAM-dependent methyltransferase